MSELARHGEKKTHEVGVTTVLDGHDTDAVELTGGGSEVNVGAVVVVNVGLGAERISECSVKEERTYSMA